jgi:glycosyltransferase involved in cell wall biosynthesis
LPAKKAMSGNNQIIMLVSNAFDPDVRVYKEALTLIGEGYRVLLLAWDRQVHTPAIETIDGIEVRRFQGSGKYGKGISSLWDFLMFYIFVFKNSMERKSHVIHCHDLDTLTVGFLVARIKRISLIYDAHEAEYFGRFPSILKKTINFFEKQLAKRANAVFVTNARQKKKFQNIPAIRTEIVEIRNCPGELFFRDLYRPRMEKQKITLGWIGYIQDKAGIREAVQAFKSLKVEFPGIEMIFVGKIHPNFFRSFTELVHGDSRIKIIGHVSYQKVRLFYPLVDIAFMLYENDPQYRSNTPTKLYEAMAQGIPVIATAIGDVREIVEESRCGFIVDIKNPNEIVEKMRILISDDEKRREMGGNGLEYARKKYRWEIMEERLIQTYGKFS